MLVELGKDCTYVKVGISLDLRSLYAGLYRQSLLQEIQCGPHLSNPAIVASHVVECHGHAQLVGLAELLGLLEKVKS
jgi:hypothetical protein